MLKVYPWKGMIRFRKKGKLNPRHLDPLKFLTRCVSRFKFKKSVLADDTLVVPLDEIQINTELHFIEEPIEIMDQEVKRFKSKSHSYC